ncbi:MAG: hypothetical protein MUD14_05710 [Hydrococcus sp. Prado102]|jgi:hypothetical protein|nr:hypothetical protein [Hydrococcus sp. Prado102]
MAFIKLDNIIVNTNFVAAVRLEGRNQAGEESVSLLIAIPAVTFSPLETTPNSSYQYEWLEFTGASARALKDYFSSFNNVLDLLPPRHHCNHLCGE